VDGLPLLLFFLQSPGFCDCIFFLVALWPNRLLRFRWGRSFVGLFDTLFELGKATTTQSQPVPFFLRTPAGSADHQPHFFPPIYIFSADPNRINVHREVQMVSLQKEAVECSRFSPQKRCPTALLDSAKKDLVIVFDQLE
jgi:hypothetical protein